MAAVWVAPLADQLIDADYVASLLSRHITPDNQVEHLQVRAGPARLLVFGFLTAATQEEARETLRQLVSSAIANEPALRLWRIV